MSTNISNVFQDYFDAEVKAAYGSDSGLQSTVKAKTGIVCKLTNNDNSRIVVPYYFE